MEIHDYAAYLEFFCHRVEDKAADPSYQSILAPDIPHVALEEGAATLRVIAGHYAVQTGPARTFSPINVWDLQLNHDGATMLELPEGHTAMLVVLSGTVHVNGDSIVRDAELVMFERT
ncbi:Pirin C-terminal cupin domain-containing protein [Modicisalibacter ilicicola DSM 19980]|uniref:Pirin C-terminal cupin domain-containing protein n=1 Tax=Modicisalibacter ilicicola DSM 19980 TaxID=1121942 RepID=A0A1M4XIG0_9GAMM|nr:Pirin C-terminal cupin domain-containing protein [Halomonas ilicicola DSM 19980]